MITDYYFDNLTKLTKFELSQLNKLLEGSYMTSGVKSFLKGTHHSVHGLGSSCIWYNNNSNYSATPHGGWEFNHTFSDKTKYIFKHKPATKRKNK